jgi:WD40 repeat protein
MPSKSCPPPCAIKAGTTSPRSAIHRSGTLLIPGFCEQVTDVSAVPNAAAQFAIASRDGRIGIVDVVSKKLLRTLDTGHAGELRLSLSADGKRLLARTSSASEAVLV